MVMSREEVFATVAKVLNANKTEVKVDSVDMGKSNGRNKKGQFSIGNKLNKNNTRESMCHYTKEFKRGLMACLPEYRELLHKLIRREITDKDVDKEALMFAIRLAIPAPRIEHTYVELHHKNLKTADQIVRAGDEVVERTVSGEMSIEECQSTLKILFEKVQLLDVAKGAAVHDALKNNTLTGLQ